MVSFAPFPGTHMKRKSEMKRLMMLVAVFTVAMQIIAETETGGG